MAGFLEQSARSNTTVRARPCNNWAQIYEYITAALYFTSKTIFLHWPWSKRLFSWKMGGSKERSTKVEEILNVLKEEMKGESGEIWCLDDNGLDHWLSIRPLTKYLYRVFFERANCSFVLNWQQRTDAVALMKWGMRWASKLLENPVQFKWRMNNMP